MSWFSRTKTVVAKEREISEGPGLTKKIVLNFRRHSAQQVRDMATGTLDAAGFDPSIADPKVGDRMLDGTVYAGDSPDTGKPMYATPTDASLMKWKEAMDYTATLNAYGHQDWRLPTKGELNVLFNNRAAIGGFNVSGSTPAGWYWSGTQVYEWRAWVQRFSDGYQIINDKDHHSSVRCVR